MSSTTTGVEMIYALFNSTGVLIGDMLPLLYLFLGVFAGLFGIGFLIWAIIKGIKKVTK